MVKLNKNRSENFLAFVSTRARSGSRPISNFHPLEVVGRGLQHQTKSYRVA